MARLTRFLRDTFDFSVAETRGFLVLTGLLALVLLIPFLWDFLPDTVPDTTAADQHQLDALVAELVVESTRRPANRYADRPGSSESESSVPARPVRRFAFDPNVISSDQWQELGLPRWLAERIGKYRVKGGHFRKKEDLLHIYDFPEDTYRELEPYIQLPGERAEPRTPEVLTAAAVPSPSAPESRPARPVPVSFDLNAADTTELKRVYGIGSKLSARIVKYRESLGGFASESQVREVWGLDSVVVAELLKHATLRAGGLRKLNVNTATVEQLRHPYLKFHVARAVVAYRQQHGTFNTPDDLLQVKVLDAATLEKLKPYLEF
jgi:competence ComEA-like helix-hairpin-helix protein